MMPQAGDSFIVEVKMPHIEWGAHRYTNSRNTIYGEGYIKIPADDAYGLGIYNSSCGNNAVYDAVSYDGFFEGQLLAQGNQSNNRYAKQFSAVDNLKAVGSWYAHVDASAGDLLKVKFTSDTSLVFELSKTMSDFHI